MTDNEKEYAGFWIRAGAAIVDGIIIVVPSIALAWLIPFLGSFLAALIYKPFFESSRLQATPGKALLGLRVESIDGQRISFRTAMIRYFMSFISSAILLIGYLMALFTSRKQCLHDMVANTVVVYGSFENINFFDCWIEEISDVFSLNKNVSTVPKNTQSNTNSVAGRLQELSDLYKKGLINETEYLSKKEEVLRQL